MGIHQGSGDIEPLPPTRTILDDNTAPAETAAEPARAGRSVGGRYVLRDRVGVGGHGEVWSALDSLTQVVVAVKLLRDAARGSFSPRVRREIAALRLLHVPGVVRLLDEGADEHGAFVVMELIAGRPFPGRGTPCAWSELSETTIALLETLARVHAAGVVHRDLKPANVLVDATGRPTLLDFGVAWAPIEPHADRVGELVGTPAYLSPEQVSREPVGPGTDLYALGVMLYEALSGRTPFASEALTAMVYARVFRDAEALRTKAPSVPRAVADTVDILLRRRLDERPRGASEVIRMLRGDRSAYEITGAVRVAIPRLGGDGPLRAVVEAARARRSVDLVGPHGTGRSRVLQEAVAALEASGLRCVRTARGSAPFASLEPILGGLDALRASGLDEVVGAVDAGLGALLAGSTVLVADDADELDAWSSKALARLVRGASMVRAFQTFPEGGVRASITVNLGALAATDLEPLFLGSERVFHLPSDAAHALWKRTGGVPARVAAEVAAWVRAGVARWEAGRLSIDRASLDALSLSALTAHQGALRAPGNSIIPRSASQGPPMSPAMVDLLAWTTLASPEASLSLLTRATELPPWHLEAALAQLEAAGQLRRTDAHTWEPASPASIEHLWSASRRRTAHAALAAVFDPGTEGRLAHLVAAASLDESPRETGHDDTAAALAREATALARRRAHEGRLGPATAALAEGLMAARRLGLDPDAPEQLELLSAWVEFALAEGTPHALDKVHYEICRSTSRSHQQEQLAALVRAALAARSGGDRGFALADAVEPFESLDLELARHTVRVQAARRTSREREEAIVEALASWAEAHDDPRVRSCRAEWRARVLYRQSRFAEAAAMHDEAVRDDGTPQRRLGALTGASSAWLDALRPDLAIERARTLRDLAARCRHAYFEAWGEHLLRAAAYRVGVALAPDVELVELVASVGMRDLEALACLNEGAVAWRARSAALAQRLAMRAHALWASSGWVSGAMVSRALSIASGGPADSNEIDALVAWATGTELARLAVQVFGLLALALPERRSALKEAAQAALAKIPLEDRDARLEVIGTREALAFFEGGLRNK